MTVLFLFSTTVIILLISACLITVSRMHDDLGAIIVQLGQLISIFDEDTGQDI